MHDPGLTQMLMSCGQLHLEDEAVSQRVVTVRVTLRRRFCFVMNMVRLSDGVLLVGFRHLAFRVPVGCDNAFRAVLAHIAEQWQRELPARVEAWQLAQVAQVGEIVHGGVAANHAALNPDGLLDAEIGYLESHLGLDFQQLRRPPTGPEEQDPESNPQAGDGQESVLFCGHQQKHSSRILATCGGRVVINTRFDHIYDGLVESLEKALSAVRYLWGVEPKGPGASSTPNGAGYSGEEAGSA